MKNCQLLTSSEHGYVGLAQCGCCLHVRFERLFWRLNREQFLTFFDYLGELLSDKGFAANQVEPGYALVMLQHQHMAALLSRAELKALTSLLEEALLAMPDENATLESQRERLERLYRQPAQ